MSQTDVNNDNKHLSIIKQIIMCQVTEPKYMGWDLTQLEWKFTNQLNIGEILFPKLMTEEVYVLHHFLTARTPNRWNITVLNKAAREARALLKLPQIEDLCPEIKPVTLTQKQNFKNLLNKFHNSH